MFAGNPADFFDKWNLVEQVLNQTKRTEEAADKAAHDGSDQHEKACYIEGKCKITAADDCLKRANRAGTEGTGAGVAVEAWNTELL